MIGSQKVGILVCLCLAALTACAQTPVPAQNNLAISKTQEDVTAQSNNFSCPHNETRQIFFSSSFTPDSLKLEIVGDDCDTARLVMTATSATGDIVYKNEIRALDYTYEGEGSKGVRAMLKNLIPDYNIRGKQLPPYAERKADQLFGKIDKAAYRDAQNKDLPLFCHTAGKSYSVCHVFSNGKAVLLYEYGT